MSPERKVPKCQNDDNFLTTQRACPDTLLSCCTLNFAYPQHCPRRLTMRLKVNFFRLLVISACLLGGLAELVRLQRSRLLMRR